MKKSYDITGIAAGLTLLLAASPSVTMAENIKVDHLGPTNTLVRINPTSRYLLMPVEESQEDARVNVLVDGRLDRTIQCRLAKEKVDYTVPLDLSAYKGHDVVLNILTPGARHMRGENVRNEVCWSNFTLSDSFDTTNREKYRPLYHHTPLYGWMNDPNGMVYKDGTWHLYYQWNPFGSKWQNMTWGHSTSTDLVNWQHHPAAIEPDGLGAIFSGSSVLDPANTSGAGSDAIVSLYTSAADSQVQSLAVSHDNGMTFRKYAGNPVITLDSEARDPNMFWYEPNKEWVLVLAHALEHEMLIYTSPNLKDWTMRSRFGKGLGSQDGVWECPDLFELPVQGTNKSKWVLVGNINPGGPFGGSATQYFVGDFDGHTFTPDLDSNGMVPVKWMDYGKDHYATVSFSDAPAGRRVLLGWMSNWEYANDVPTKQFRSANTLPRDAALFVGADKQIYLASAPSPEVDALRSTSTVDIEKVSLRKDSRKFTLPSANYGICEIDLAIPTNTNGNVRITLANNRDEKTVMTYNPAERTVSFNRTESGITDFAPSFPAVTTAPVLYKSKMLTLRIFVDRSSIEIFGNDGRLAMTNLVFPTAPYSTLTLESDGNANIRDLKVFPLATPDTRK